VAGAQFDEAEKQRVKEKTVVEEEERTKEIETLQQRHAEVINEIDQLFVRIPQHLDSNVFSLHVQCISKHAPMLFAPSPIGWSIKR